MHVLLVEDDVLLGQAIEMALARWSHTSVWVRDGKTALSAAGAGGFDLVLLDLGLPQVGGIDVLQTLRTQSDAVPVLIITARDTLTDRIGGLDAGRMTTSISLFIWSKNLILVGPLCLDPMSATARSHQRKTQSGSR